MQEVYLVLSGIVVGSISIAAVVLLGAHMAKKRENKVENESNNYIDID